MLSTGEGNGKPLQYSCLENPMNSMKRQNDRILKEELPRSVGAQYAAGDQWRNNSRNIEGMEPKQKQYPVVDVTGDRSKVRCCKEQYCIGTWNVRSMNLHLYLHLILCLYLYLYIYSIYLHIHICTRILLVPFLWRTLLLVQCHKISKKTISLCLFQTVSILDNHVSHGNASYMSCLDTE